MLPMNRRAVLRPGNVTLRVWPGRRPALQSWVMVPMGAQFDWKAPHEHDRGRDSLSPYSDATAPGTRCPRPYRVHGSHTCPKEIEPLHKPAAANSGWKWRRSAETPLRERFRARFPETAKVHSLDNTETAKPESLRSLGSAMDKGTGRLLILVTAFLGWFFAGVLMSTSSLSMRSAAIDLLSRTGVINLTRYTELNRVLQERDKKLDSSLANEDFKLLKSWRSTVQAWFAYYQCAFLFGAAAGGFLFGRLGDSIGRSKAMAVSILCYSVFPGAAYFAQTPLQLLVLWFLGALGVGGMWPNGVALVSETWSQLSRPLAAGIIGTSANIGIFALATIATRTHVTPDHWRWTMLVCASAVVLGLFVLAIVPESPRWLEAGALKSAVTQPGISTSEIFQRPFLSITLVGIALATIPMIGGWGSANWMIPWAGEAGESANPPNPYLQAQVGQARALTGIVGSLLGGVLGSVFGRRRAYCLVSLAALFCAQYAFWFTVPTDASFLFWVSALGFFSGIYFGWLPLFLPELFPTRIRSTGAGVSFNFGRIVTAATVFGTGALMSYFGGDYARIGRITSLIYAVGLAAIWFAPDTSRRQLED